MLKKLFFVCTLLLAVIVAYTQVVETITSPDGNIVLKISAVGKKMVYEVGYKSKAVIKNSQLGFVFKQPAVRLDEFEVLDKKLSITNEKWNPVWGEVKEISNHYNQVVLQLKGQSDILVDITFRVFNDGVGFRYSFPMQSKLSHFVVQDELTQFAVADDHKTFWIPGDYDTNEFMYNTSTLSEVDAGSSKMSQEIFAKSFFDKNAVQTPLMMKSKDGLYINIHEAALVNYPAMNLVIDKSTLTLHAHLVPDPVGNKAYLQTPAVTPWRTIVVSDKATDILASKMILNLNEPSTIANTSWIKPQKYIGIWWEMHVGKGTWDYAGSQDMNSWENLKNAKPTGKHSATTANTKRYIDFAAAHGFDGVLVEGWNVGWEDWFGKWKEDVFDFITPYPDYDVKYLTEYAKSKGVRIIAHHETSGAATNYERWMDTAYRFMKNHNMNSVKTGYVGYIIPRGEHHDGQWMVKHYERVAKKTASYQIMLDAHEPVHPTGLHRTYPNWMACEAARGNEFNAWSAGNKPEHETILPFTRLMGGPMDYTPGIFKIKLNVYEPNKKEQVHTTLAKQLALYVTMYSPLQMAADIPENYEAKMDAFQFIKDVAVDWDDTKYLEAEPGDYMTVARKAKNSDNWFIGSITDENVRATSVALNFLDANKKYIATIYRDADNAHWENNPEAYAIDKMVVDSKAVLKLKLAVGGGAAISIVAATPEMIKKVQVEMKMKKRK
jgi:glucan 1,4-alpha-glucosidase